MGNEPTAVPIEKLLLGGNNGHPGAAYAALVGDLFLTSTKLVDGPHVELLRMYQLIGEELFKPSVYKETAYYKHALACITHSERYFNAFSEPEIVKQIRRFTDHFDGRPAERGLGQSELEALPRVVPNRYSSYFEIVDGHHRAAILAVKGIRSFPCEVLSGSSFTAMQQLVLTNTWTPWQQVLYQPLELPEFESFRLVRKCTDRLELMLSFLRHEGIESGSFMDLSCSFGYFVHEFNQAGFDAYGVDTDRSSLTLAREYFGIPEDRLHRTRIESALLQEVSYDIVACLSIFHHYVAKQRGCEYPLEKLVSLLANASRRVLFFEMGQEHEAWFRESLRGWNDARIVDFLMRNGDFERVEKLGSDTDNVGEYADNYARSLFACVKTY